MLVFGNTLVCETLLEGITPNHSESEHTLRLKRFKNTKPTLEMLWCHWSTGYSSYPITASPEAVTWGFTQL